MYKKTYVFVLKGTLTHQFYKRLESTIKFANIVVPLLRDHPHIQQKVVFHEKWVG